jgi:hypothetical protein
MHLSRFGISAFQAGPDLTPNNKMAEKRILRFVSVNPRITFSMDLDLRLRHSEALGRSVRNGLLAVVIYDNLITTLSASFRMCVF